MVGVRFIAFDEPVVLDFIGRCREFVDFFSGWGSIRSGGLEQVFSCFVGPYARLFERAAEDESRDRARMADAFEALVAQLEEVCYVARCEEERREQHFHRQEAASKFYWRDDAVEALDLFPESEYRPPNVAVGFTPLQRVRVASQGYSERVAADPVVLRGLAREYSVFSMLLEDRLKDLERLWARCISTCSWAGFGSLSVFSGVRGYLAENREDQRWLEAIAGAFERAGGQNRRLTGLDLTVAVIGASIDPSYVGLLFNSLDLSVEEIESIAAALAGERRTRQVLAAYVAGVLDGLTLDASGTQIARAGALLRGMSVSADASAVFLRRVPAEDLIDRVALAGLFAHSGKFADANGYIHGLREVFRAGEPCLAQSDPAFVKQYAHDLFDATLTPKRVEPTTGNATFALSYLLRDSALSSEFLLTVGARLESFEREFPDPAAGWLALGQQGRGMAGFFPADKHGSANDASAALMSAFGKSPQASLEFFSSFDPQTMSAPTDRQRYWIAERPWGEDGFESITGALDAATTTPGNIGTAQASSLATSAVKMLANRNFAASSEQFVPSSIHPRVAMHMANVLSAYMPAVDFYVTEPPTARVEDGQVAEISRDDLGTILDMPVFAPDDLNALITTITQVDDGAVALRMGMDAYHDRHLAQVISTYRDRANFQDILNEAAAGGGALEGFVLNAVGEAAIAAGEERDRETRAWIGLQRHLVEVIPVDRVPVAGPLLNALTGQAFDVIEEHAGDAYARARSEAVQAANTAADMAYYSYATRLDRAVIEGGLVTDEDDRELIPEVFAEGFPSMAELAQNQGLTNRVGNVGDNYYDSFRVRVSFDDQFSRRFQ